MIHQKHGLSQRQSKSSDHRIHYKPKLNYPSTRSPFAIHHNDSNDSYSPQPVVLQSKANSNNLTKTNFKIKNHSPHNKFLKYQDKFTAQSKQFIQSVKKMDFIPLRTISYQQTTNFQKNLRGQTIRAQLFSRQNIQQNNKKLNLLRKQNNKQISPTKNLELSGQYKQSSRTRFKSSTVGNSPLFKVTPTHSNFCRNQSGSKTAEVGKKIRESFQKAVTDIKNRNQNVRGSKNQIKFKNTIQKQKDKHLNELQFGCNSKQLMNVDSQMVNSQQLIVSKTFIESQLVDNQNDDALRPVKMQTYTYQQPINNSLKSNLHSSKTNRKSVPLFLGIYNQEKRQLANQNFVEMESEQILIQSKQQPDFRPKLKMKKIDDNMNVLASILRKKSNIMSKKQLIEYLHKIIS